MPPRFNLASLLHCVRLAFVCLVGIAAVIVGLSEGRAAERPPIRAFSVEQIEAFGQQIFQQDHEVATATDALFAQKDFDPANEHMRGWIVTSSSGKDRVRFVRIMNDEPEAAYDVVLMGEEPVISIPTDRTLTPEEVAQFNARELALQHIEKPCSRSYNTVVLPDPEAPGWIAWALAATNENDVMVMGGHYRFTISADGMALLKADALSLSCLDEKIPREKNVKAMFITHLVSNTPVETHVFMSLLHAIPLYVGVAKDQGWLVENGKMKRAK